jgi:hypothetical protein
VDGDWRLSRPGGITIAAAFMSVSVACGIWYIGELVGPSPDVYLNVPVFLAISTALIFVCVFATFEMLECRRWARIGCLAVFLFVLGHMVLIGQEYSLAANEAVLLVTILAALLSALGLMFSPSGSVWFRKQ